MDTVVETSTQIWRPDPLKKPVKRAGSNSGGGPAAKKTKNKSDKEKKQGETTKTPSWQVDVSTPLPSSSTLASDRTQLKRSETEVPSAAEDALQKQKEIADHLNEEGPEKATLADLQACLRVSQSGVALFEELKRLVAGEMTNRIRAYSKDNRGLKEELKKLKDVEERLEAANKQVLEQQKQLDWLPTLTLELEVAQKKVGDTEATVQQYNGRIQQLEAEAREHNNTLAKCAKGGFERAGLKGRLILLPFLSPPEILNT